MMTRCSSAKMCCRILQRWVRNFTTPAIVEKKSEEPIMMVPRSEDVPDRTRKRVIITLLGCHNTMGHITATCLKLKCQDLKELRMWDTEGTLRGTTLELSHLPTSSRVLPYLGKGQLQMALRHADVVMIMGGNTGFPRESTSDLFSRNSQYMRDMTQAVISHAPRALIGICVKPIMPNLAFFSMMQRLQGVFCPNRVLGVVSLDEMRAGTLAAVKLGLPPGTVKIQLTGGATPDTVLPIMSSAKPGGDFLKPDLIELMNLLRNMTANVKEAGGRGPYFSEGHATANFVMALAKGLCSDDSVAMSSVIRNSSLFGIPYLTLPLVTGRTGVMGTTGIPRLSSMELKALIRSLPTIVEHISLGESAASQKDLAQDDILDLYQ